MKQILLLSLVSALFTLTLFAQKKSKKQQNTIAYAITGVQKGQNNWTEARLVDLTSGEVIKSIYESKQEAEILNARTGKPVVKKDNANDGFPAKTVIRYNSRPEEKEINTLTATAKPGKKVINLDDELIQAQDANAVRVRISGNSIQPLQSTAPVKKIMVINGKVNMDKPFATTSAACAYDKKHERLYYTPMGINQLRYIDLKSNTIYYFEDESFGVLSGRGDVQNQITRMVIASDGNGYALTNNGQHLMRFTTNKKAEITDLGALTDNAANGNFAIHSAQGYGGDMIADDAGNLYLITANRRVFKISIKDKVAEYKGSIRDLPKEYSTNGAIVEEGTKVIVSSANSTLAYYRFDMNTLQAEKIANSGNVFNASDLANSNLLSVKKKKKEKKEEEQPVIVKEEETQSRITEKAMAEETSGQYKISIYPNPVTNGLIKLSFENHPQGRYQINFMDITGRTLSSKLVTIANSVQIEEFKLPSLITKGNYLLKVIGEANNISSVNKIAVQ